MEKWEIIPGRNPVFEYISQTVPPVDGKLLMSKTAHGKIIEKIKLEAKRKGIPIDYCEKGFLSRYDAATVNQGVVLLLPKKNVEAGNNDFLEYIQSREGVIVLLDQITDPHNVGSIIRSTEALGGDCVVLTKSYSPGISPIVVKSSAGATTHLRILTVSNVANFIDRAKKIGFWIIGTSQSGDSKPSNLRNLKPLVLIIGSEGKGLRKLTEKKCDHIVKIPIKGKISSLNASVAAGIVLYEILR